jgi:branched-chain amino acid aminotransferase/para-aminobenzoate synthetase component 1
MKGFQESPPPEVWLNGRFLPVDKAAVSPLDRGFLYGDGVFETMRVEGGAVLYLEEHQERAARSLALLRINAELPPDSGEIIRELIHRNGLAGTAAAAKIVITRGVAPGLGLPAASAPTIWLTAHPYAPPAPSVYQNGWHLEFFREGFSPPLAAHKTLNYLYFLVARQAALDAGGDEAVILDHQGRITETSAGSIMARSSNTWWTPTGPYQLTGITIRQVTKILHRVGQEVEPRRAVPRDLLSADTIWIVNSLMGVMPVSRVQDHPVPHVAAEEAARLRDYLFEQGRLPGTDRSF